jgi:arginase
MTPGDWFLLGAPWDCSGTGRGEADAPDALRRAGALELVADDAGDADTAIEAAGRDPDTGVLGLESTVRAARALSVVLGEAMAQRPGMRPLVLGGDCSILLGLVPALRRASGPVGLWFVDGHPDFQDGTSSATGETADMDLAVLTGLGAEALVTLDGPPPLVAASDVVLIGYRTEGLDAAASAEVGALPADLHRIDASGVIVDPSAAGRRAARLLAASGRPTWLHLDLDVLDPTAFESVTYPQPGGPDWDQLAALLLPLTTTPGLLGVSIADHRPDLDPAGTGASRILDLLATVLP